MKSTKKVIYMLGFLLIVVFTSCFFATKHILAKNVYKLYLEKIDSGTVDKGNNVEVKVCLDSNGVNGIQGLIEYDSELKLVNIQRALGYQYFRPTSYKPESVATENEIFYNGKKAFSFALCADNDLTDENFINNTQEIFILTFNTSNCKNGYTYNINWNTSEQRGFDPKTSIRYKGGVVNDLVTQGTQITISGNKEDDSNTNTQSGAEQQSNNGSGTISEYTSVNSGESSSNNQESIVNDGANMQNGNYGIEQNSESSEYSIIQDGSDEQQTSSKTKTELAMSNLTGKQSADSQEDFPKTGESDSIIIIAVIGVFVAIAILLKFVIKRK